MVMLYVRLLEHITYVKHFTDTRMTYSIRYRSFPIRCTFAFVFLFRTHFFLCWSSFFLRQNTTFLLFRFVLHHVHVVVWMVLYDMMWCSVYNVLSINGNHITCWCHFLLLVQFYWISIQIVRFQAQVWFWVFQMILANWMTHMHLLFFFFHSFFCCHLNVIFLFAFKNDANFALFVFIFWPKSSTNEPNCSDNKT